MSLTDSPDFDVRFTALSDEHFVRKWLESPGMLHWFPFVEGIELENFVRLLMGFCRFHSSLTATYKGTPVGLICLFLMPYKKVAHHCLFQIMVDPEMQRQGVGRSLMKNGMHLAKTRFKLEMMHAEVLGESSLTPLLRSLSFVEVGVQGLFAKEGGHYVPRTLFEVTL